MATAKMDYRVSVGLHSSTRKLNITKEDLHVGSVGPITWRCARSVAKGTRTGPKLNNAAVVLEYLLTKRLSVFVDDQAGFDKCIYVEKFKDDGTVETRYYGNASKLRTVLPLSAPEINTRSFVPVVLCGLLSGNMPDTWDLFEKCVAEYKVDGAVSQQTLFTYCDSFYREWQEKCSDVVEVFDDFDENEVRQAIRTLSLGYALDLTDLGIEIPPCEIGKDILEELNSTVPSPASKGTSDPFADARNGKYLLDYCWSLEQQAKIPPLESLDRYAPCDEFFTLLELASSDLGQVLERVRKGAYGVEAIGSNFVNAILLGKPGTGKTELANQLGAALGVPVYVDTVSNGTEEDQYQGMTKVAEGGFKFVSTAFMEAYKNGGIIILEEFNLARPGVMQGALGQAIVSPFILKEDGVNEVRRHPLCIVIATMNPETQGSREPSEAFTSRMPNVFVLNDPEEESFIKILQFGGYSKTDCTRVYKAFKKIQTHLSSSEVDARDIAMSLTLRHCQAALKQMKNGRPFKSALRNTLIGAIAIKDMQLALQTYDAVVEPMA